jgi:hypothetical protein
MISTSRQLKFLVAIEAKYLCLIKILFTCEEMIGKAATISGRMQKGIFITSEMELQRPNNEVKTG